MMIGLDPRSTRGTGAVVLDVTAISIREENKKKDQYIIGLLGYYEVRAHHMTKCDIEILYQIFERHTIL